MYDGSIIFLDIDGVLNDHHFDPEVGSSTISPHCMSHLNSIVKATGAKIVISSAWRYMVVQEAMTLSGFEYMLKTHGAKNVNIIGVTMRDEWCALCEHRHPKCDWNPETKKLSCPACHKEVDRAQQILHWINNSMPKSYVVIDNDDFGFTANNMPFVHTNGDTGLNRDDAEKAIALLEGTK